MNSSEWKEALRSIDDFLGSPEQTCSSSWTRQPLEEENEHPKFLSYRPEEKLTVGEDTSSSRSSYVAN